MAANIQAAVLVEQHPYNVVAFQRMLDSFEDCDCFVQPVDLFVQDEDNRARYDAVLWYNIHWDPPEGILQKYLENEIGRTKQGIVLLHHALLSFQDWEVYTEICGLRRRGSGGLFKYTQNQTVVQRIADPAHPVTQGLDDFTIIDETYTIGEPEEPGNHILITTGNETSIKNLAWTRRYRESRVFAYASGHDSRAYSHGSFRKALHQGLRWAAGKDEP